MSVATTWRVRTAGDLDLERIVELWERLVAFHTDLDPRLRMADDGREHFYDHLLDALDSPSSRALVVEHDGEVVGFALGHVCLNPPVLAPRRYGLISDAFVEEDERRRGAGEALFNALLLWFRAVGVQELQLNAAHLNPIAQSFWRKMGFSDFLDRLWREV